MPEHKLTAKLLSIAFEVEDGALFINAFGLDSSETDIFQGNDGIFMSASAGNEGENLQRGGDWYLPGGLQGVMNVGATGPNDERVVYSNTGARWIDVVATGGGYETASKWLCTANGLVAGCDHEDDELPEELLDLVDECGCEPGSLPYPCNLIASTGFWDGQPAMVRFSGTSAAAPQVAGIAALVSSANPTLHARQVDRVIEQSAQISHGR